ncbi:MAG: alginate export family protein [Deltaproteobacteria bacterium]|nr:alginate export family protein [Deltaproteobacteria bacterium]
MTFGGQYRLRGEYRDNVDYNDDLSDSTDFWTQRVRLTANAAATDDTSIKITLQDTRTFGATGVLTDDTVDNGVAADSGTDNFLDLHEAYLNVKDIFGAPVSFRAGRQELNYGDQRLVGGFGWSNNGRAFDGFKFMYSNDMVDVDAFSMTITEDTAATNDDTYFNGVYATLKQLVPNNTVDAYLFHQTDGTALTRYTLGARVKGALAGVDYTVELPYQFGEASDTVDISAWALAVKAGYTLPTPMKIRVGAEYDFATGDEAGSADENEAFNNLFPTNHAHFGIGDVVNTWSDIQAWSLNASVDVNEKLNVYVAYWNYTEDEVPSGADDDLGSEIDLVASYKYSNSVGIEAGAARFYPGDRTAVTPDDPQDWAYLQLTANF